MTDRSSDWRDYYASTQGRPPRRTLLAALDAFGAGQGRFAVDLGSGDGRDTIELLRRGWKVLAIDSEPAATMRLRARHDLPEGALLETRVMRFEESDWPAADLVNASFALPLAAPADFPALWQKLRRSLKPGGRFAGQLFGERDSWRGEKAITFLTRADALGLLQGLAIETFEEEESDSLTHHGKAKHWHLFHVVARRDG